VQSGGSQLKGAGSQLRGTGLQDLLLESEVVDLKQEVPDLRSGGTGIPPPQFNPWPQASIVLNLLC